MFVQVHAENPGSTVLTIFAGQPLCASAVPQTIPGRMARYLEEWSAWQLLQPHSALLAGRESIILAHANRNWSQHSPGQQEDYTDHTGQ